MKPIATSKMDDSEFGDKKWAVTLRHGPNALTEVLLVRALFGLLETIQDHNALHRADVLNKGFIHRIGGGEAVIKLQVEAT